MECGNQCLSVFENFIQDIIKVFPEYQVKLEDVYMEVLLLESCQLDQQELLLEFLDRVQQIK